MTARWVKIVRNKSEYYHAGFRCYPFQWAYSAADDAWKIQPEDIGELVADVLKMNARTLPSKIEVRPSMPSGK